MTRTDPYSLHRAPQVDAHLAYCSQAQATLDRIAKRRTLMARLLSLFR